MLSDYGLWLLLLIASEVTDVQELVAEPAVLLCQPDELWSRFEESQRLPHLGDLADYPDAEELEKRRTTWLDGYRIAAAGVRERLHRLEEYADIRDLCSRQASLCYYLIDALNPQMFVWSRRWSFKTALEYGEAVIPWVGAVEIPCVRESGKQ